MIEAYVILSLIFGGMLGYAVNKSPETIHATKPSEWPSKQHHEGMLMCRTMCGEDKVLKYDILIGECKCKGYSR